MNEWKMSLKWNSVLGLNVNVRETSFLLYSTFEGRMTRAAVSWFSRGIL